MWRLKNRKRVTSLLLAFSLLWQTTAVPLVLAQEEAGLPGNEETVNQEQAATAIEEEPASTGSETTADEAPPTETAADQSGEPSGEEEAVPPACLEDCPSVEATNEDTGAGSQNQSQAEGSEEVTVTNENAAEVTTEVGAEADSGGNQANKNDDDVDINTQEATASAQLASEVNTNLTGVGGSAPGAVANNQNTGAESVNEATASASLEVVVANQNEAEVNTEVGAEAGSGNNEASKNDGDVTITTGGAQALVNVINFVNTNITGLTWEELIWNLFGSSSEDVNLIEAFAALLAQSLDPGALAINQATGEGSTNTATADASLGLTVTNQNSGSLTNTISAEASTGGNTAAANDGDVAINTGDALAIVNLLNFFNTNLTGSQFLVALINIFGLWEGDLILPAPGVLEAPGGAGGTAAVNAETGADSTNTAAAAATQTTAVTNTNQSEVTSNVTTTADSGGNQASKNDGDVTIETGPTLADAITLNFINTNLVGNNFIFLLINNLGHWTGLMIGWLCGTEPASDSLVTTYEADIDSTCPDCPAAAAINSQTGAGSTNEAQATATQALAVTNDNQAAITNNVTATATTGGNTANSNDGDVSITTGSATALASIINFVNTNVTGSRFLFGIVNIFGSWTGDLIFGSPDLTVAIDDYQEEVDEGQVLEYLVTYRNIGLAPAVNSLVTVTLPEGVIYQGDTTGTSPLGSGQTWAWLLAGLGTGEAASFTVLALVPEGRDPGSYDLTASASVATRATECDLTNNQDSDLTKLVVPQPGVPDEPQPPEEPTPPGDEPNPPGPEPTPGDEPSPGAEPQGVSEPAGDPLSIYKFNDSGGAAKHRGDQVTFTVVLTNNSDRPMYAVVVRDYLEDPLGVRIREQSWDLGTVAVGEEITMNYTIEFSQEAPLGTYTNYAQATGRDADGVNRQSALVSSSVSLELRGAVIAAAGPVGGEVLGAATSLPATGADAWRLLAAGLCLVLAGLILRWGFPPSTKAKVEVRPLISLT